jgi:uncharacterized protein (TIRG00374 family)
LADHATDAVAVRPVSRRRRSVARRTVGGTVKLIIFLTVFVFFGLPAITNARDSIRRLSTVEPVLLGAGLGLELLSLLAYSQLTRAALPRGTIGLPLLTRIQLTTRAITNVVPGGSAAGSAVGYRLLTLGGVRGADAGFALVTSGVISAVMLNLLLWITLVVSIPAAGFRPVYVTMALTGVLVIAAFGSLVLGLIYGEQHALRFVRSLARHVRFLKEDRLTSLVSRLAERLRDLVADRELLRRLVMWSLFNWLLDAAALWVFLRAFGPSVRVDSLLVAFCVANISAVIPITPGGLGVFDATLVAMLALFGHGDSAGLAVPMYRLAQYWVPIPLGALSYITLRAGPWSIEEARDLGRLREETQTAVQRGESVYEWAE